MALEFAVTAGCLFTLLLASLELGRYIFTSQSLNYLVGRAARESVIAAGSGSSGCSSVAAQYAPYAPILKAVNLELQRCIYPPNSTENTTSFTRIDVTASYPFSTLLPLLRSSLPPVTQSITLSITT